jgi:OmpA-OmpF porin, OOP family
MNFMKSILIALFSFVSIFSFAQSPKIQDNKLVLDKAVSFKTGSTELTDEGKEALTQVRDFLIAKDYITTLRVEGHTANDGIEGANQILSEKRALAICLWLMDNKIDCKRLIAVGFGSTKPVADNSTPAGKSENRRIEFTIAALRGKAIGGMPLDGGGKVAGDLCAD